MTHATRARSGARREFAESSQSKGAPWRHRRTRETPTSIARELGPCVYFIRSNDDLVKIGFTTNIANRKGCFGVGWSSILAVVPGVYDDEQELHRRFAPHRVRGDEWYAPAPQIIRHINDIRARLGISPIEPW